MMNENTTLSRKKCVICTPDIPPMGMEEAKRMLDLVPEWELALGGRAIKRRFIFKDFASPLTLINKIAGVAQAEGHHPDLMLGWGYAECVLWTHVIAGLHENDFIVAAKINELK